MLLKGWGFSPKVLGFKFSITRFLAAFKAGAKPNITQNVAFYSKAVQSLSSNALDIFCPFKSLLGFPERPSCFQDEKC